MRLATITFAVLSLWTSATSAAFGLSSDSTYFTVDAGSANPLIFKVNKNNCDITSILYRGVELQNQNPYSHLISGLGNGVNVQGTTIGGLYPSANTFGTRLTYTRLHQDHLRPQLTHSLLCREEIGLDRFHGDSHHRSA